MKNVPIAFIEALYLKSKAIANSTEAKEWRPLIHERQLIVDEYKGNYIEGANIMDLISAVCQLKKDVMLWEIEAILNTLEWEVTDGEAIEYLEVEVTDDETAEH